MCIKDIFRINVFNTHKFDFMRAFTRAIHESLKIKIKWFYFRCMSEKHKFKIYAKLNRV